MICLQGGPSHIDLWDPKENVPDNVKSALANIKTKIPGVNYTVILPAGGPEARRRVRWS